MLKEKTTKAVQYNWIFSLPFVVIGWLAGIVMVGLTTGWMWAWKVRTNKSAMTSIPSDKLFDVLDDSIQLCIASRIAALEEDINRRTYWEGAEMSLRVIKKILIKDLRLHYDTTKVFRKEKAQAGA